MRRVAIVLTLVCAAALGCAADPTAKPDAATDGSADDVTDAPGDGAADSLDGAADADTPDGPPGTLAILQLDGTPVPPVVGYGGVPLVVEADDVVTGQGSNDTQWTATGSCQLASPTVGLRLVVGPVGAGVCTLTATANGTTATATYTIVFVSGINIDGDTSPMIVGERRTFTAVALSGTTELPDLPLDLVPTLCDADVFGDMVTLTSTAIGHATLTASVGTQQAGIAISVVPASLVLSLVNKGPAVLRPGDSATVAVTAFGLAGVVGLFSTDIADLKIVGADGFSSVQEFGGTTQILFVLSGAMASSPSVTATYGTVVSNALSFSVSPGVAGSPGGALDAGGDGFGGSVHDAASP